MQYEIAHCRHATEGAASRLWYTTSWLEERALLWALEYASPRPPPHTSPHLGSRVGGKGEGRRVGCSEVHPPHNCPLPGIKLSKSESRVTTVLLRIGEDSWHLDHRCRSVLDDQSYAALLDIFEWGEEGGDKRLHWRRSKLSKTAFLLKTWMQPVLLSWSWISHNTDSQETGSLASKAASSQLPPVSNSWFAIQADPTLQPPFLLSVQWACLTPVQTVKTRISKQCWH